MHILFPSDPLNPGKPDETFMDQAQAFESTGCSWSLCSIEEIEVGERGLRGTIPPGSSILYRGWMLSPPQYISLLERLDRADGKAMINLETYLATHYLPNWYPLLREFTPETKVVSESDDLESELRALNWDAFFIKDYVKSLKTSVGAVVRDPSDIGLVVEEMRKYRGEIEGGICIRRFEELKPESEVRYFVIHGIPFAASPDDAIPEIVSAAAPRIQSPFFSIDVAERSDGQQRIVEIGDGQVSDIVGWSAERLAAVWS